MGNTLRIDSSSRTQGSQSRLLGDHFEKIWLGRNPSETILRRDLIFQPIPPIANETIAGFYTPDDQLTPELRAATALSDELIGEIKTADAVLLTIPMYNFTIPSAFKAWVDQIVRIGHTFSFDGKSFTGLVTGKRAYVFCSYGAGGYVGGPLSAYDFLQPYLKLLFGFLGFTEVHFFQVEATTADGETVNANIGTAQRAIEDYFATIDARSQLR